MWCNNTVVHYGVANYDIANDDREIWQRGLYAREMWVKWLWRGTWAENVDLVVRERLRL